MTVRDETEPSGDEPRSDPIRKRSPYVAFDFDTWLIEQRAMLMRVASGLTRDTDDAEDLVQDTIRRALENRSCFDDGNRARAWSIRTMRNAFIDNCRRRKHKRVSLSDVAEQAATPPDRLPLWRRVSSEDVAAAIAWLPTELREPLELQRLNRSYKEIAMELGVPKNTVGTRLRRARIMVRGRLLAIMDQRGVQPGE